ncbi:MAG: exosortase/archaeosortase family protein [Candidatus Tectomicrobia bacterium]|nr:exosortase/archaeosortase family protein [Candidatus Tectomicrobia bacterium]
MKLTYLFLAAQLIAFWPVWRWYLARVTDGSDEPWGLLALGTALLFLLLYGKPAALRPRQWVLATLIAGVYAALWPWCPPLVRAILALTAIGCTLSCYCLGRTLHLGILGLLLLSLPLIASLQFYLGYPVRWLTAHLSAQLIQLTGYATTAQGTLLLWLGETIAVDAPCAGIRMMWTGLYLNFTLACFTRLNARATWLAYSLSMGAIFVGNVIRATLLFYHEAGIVQGATWLHSGIGLAVFSAVAIAILSVNRITGRMIPCT